MADRRLQVFYTVVKAGSFTKAAERLFMTQPAVTFQIKQLEEHFNTRLLERGHGKLKLTPAGEIVFAYAEKMLSLDEELETRNKAKALLAAVRPAERMARQRAGTAD